MQRLIFAIVLACSFIPHARSALAADLVLNNQTVTLGGTQTYGTVSLTNGSKIIVAPFNGTDKDATGNLVIRASTITIDATSSIDATGAGYQPVRCGNGPGPAASTGGRGGCAVRDSGGGGAHFGAGGRGTKDCNAIAPNDSCQFPQEFEEDCVNSLNGAGDACSTTSDCRNNDGLPTVAGLPFRHSIYTVEFGAAGGDKGCRDGDGFGSNPVVAGAGGGRVVLAAVTAGQTGKITIQGKILADGKRGCGNGNDSAGGGAGGGVVIVGDQVTIGAAARVSAGGGLGGDTQGGASCPGPAQQGGTCDDCGGGGGGGIVAVQSRTATIAQTAQFNVDGAVGGTCTICQGEAGGGAGELQIDGAFVGEVCDGFDNDFNGATDDGLPPLNCGGTMMPSCVAGVPQQCPTTPACVGPVTDTRARFAVIVDSSGSMLTDLAGLPTMGDGSTGHVGIDANSDGVQGNDSKLFIAKRALTNVISAYPELDWALARYHQDQAVNRSCQLAHWFECSDICCSYDDPRNNTGANATPTCTLNVGASGTEVVQMNSPGDECINYAGSCGPARRGADFVAGFGKPIDQYLMWLDNREMSFLNTTTVGDYCAGGDCELRGTGPTPLAGSLQAAQDFLVPIRACDGAVPCRKYAVILLTDGAESCLGNPVAAASALFNAGIELFVIGFSVQTGEISELNAIAKAGSGNARNAFLAGNESELVNALASIVAGSIVFEKCNGLDDDCDDLIDEDFPDKGDTCDDGGFAECLGTGLRVCNATQDGTTCQITDPGDPPGTEVCNGQDDNCNGLVDEGLSCSTPCTPSGPEVCDGLDNDCDGAVDEEDPMLGDSCGVTDTPPCRLGELVCIGGQLQCVGNIDPSGTGETCNGMDDDCDGMADELAPCPGETSCIDGECRVMCDPGEFPCSVGYTCIDNFCLPSECLDCADNEICVANACVDPCEGVECADNEQCSFGTCYDCRVTGCPDGLICYERVCQADRCEDAGCAASQDCVDGACQPACVDDDCPAGQRCDAMGLCAPDACAGVDCEGTQVCVGGACVDDPCTRFCGEAEVCVNDECVSDPCLVIDCAEGRTCVVDPVRGARCVPPQRGPIVEVLATGGGGCSCNTTREDDPPWMLIAFLGLVLVRRRRS